VNDRNPTLSITVTNENGMQLKFRTTMDDLLLANPYLTREYILNEIADEGEAWLQSGTIAKLVHVAPYLLAEVQ
jgi:hypothetical protein